MKYRLYASDLATIKADLIGPFHQTAETRVFGRGEGESDQAFVDRAKAGAEEEIAKKEARASQLKALQGLCDQASARRT